MRLQGKKALITGTAQGLGQHMAFALGAEGCDVAGFDIRADQLADTTQQIKDMGVNALGLEVDIMDFDATQEAVSKVYDEFGDIDFLVCNAGKGQRQPFWELTKDVWDYMINVNLNSLFHVCYQIVPRMKEKQDGRIVTVSSIAATRGGRILGKTAYASAKGGVIGFTKSLSYELAPYKVTVNCIAPGVQSTPRRAQDSPEEQELIMSQIPMKELGEPPDLAQTVVFLCLPSSRYITGVVIPQDGGHTT